MTDIKLLTDNGIKTVATFSIDCKRALIAFIRQLRGDYQTWTYPEHIDGMYESTTRKGVWYFEDGNNVYGAFSR